MAYQTTQIAQPNSHAKQISYREEENINAGTKNSGKSSTEITEFQGENDEKSQEYMSFQLGFKEKV